MVTANRRLRQPYAVPFCHAHFPSTFTRNNIIHSKPINMSNHFPTAPNPWNTPFRSEGGETYELQSIPDTHPRPSFDSISMVEDGWGNVNLMNIYEEPPRWKRAAFTTGGVVGIVVAGTLMVVSYLTCGENDRFTESMKNISF